MSASFSTYAQDFTNTDFVDGYTIADLGVRYQTKIAGKHVVWRLAVDNITDKRYWANITPSGQNGFNSTDNGTGTIGAPRTIRASLQINL